MSDVARQAGVSLMTVSRVINNKGDVNPETRQRILEIISSLGYRPSGIARSLATKETYTLGLVVPDVSNPFFADITQGVEHLAHSNGYHVFLCNAEEDPQRESALIQSLEEKRVDGLILCSSRLEEEKLIGIIANLPAVVLVNRRLQTAQDAVDTVNLDDERCGWIAADHLLHGRRVPAPRAVGRVKPAFLHLDQHEVDLQMRIGQQRGNTDELGEDVARDAMPG